MTANQVELPAPANAPQVPADPAQHAHIIQFFSDDATRVDAIAALVGAGLAAQDAVLVTVVPALRDQLRERLAQRGFDVDAEQHAGHLIWLDAEAMLESFMVDGMPDSTAFKAHVGSIVSAMAVSSPRRRVRGYGEAVDLLWRSGRRQAAVALEALYDELSRTQPLSMVCGYAMGNFSGDSDAVQLKLVCQQHSHVMPADVRTDDSPEQLRRQLALSQQQNLALETELSARRHLERELRVALEERHRQGEQLRESRKELHDFLENAVEGIHWLGADGVIQWANRAQLELLGYSAAEYVGHPISDFHVGADQVADLLARLKRFETIVGLDVRMRAKDGSLKNVSLNSNVYQRDGEFVHSRCFMRDVTQLKRDREDLALQATILSHVQDAVFMVDVADTIWHWTDGAAKVFGFAAEDVLGQPTSMLGRDAAQVDAARAAAASHPVEWQGAHRDGSSVWVDETSSELLDSQGRLMGRVVIGRDVSERKRLAERTARLQVVTTALNQAYSPRGVGSVAVEQGVLALGARTGALMTLEGENPYAELQSSFGYSTSMRERFTRVRLDDQHNPVAFAMRSQKPVWAQSMKEFSERSPLLVASLPPTVDFGFVCLPLTVEQRCIGCLSFTFEPNQNRRDDERVLFDVLARQTALAFERARLFEQTQMARVRASFLAEASERLSTTLEPEKVLHTLARLAVPMLGDWGCVDALDELGQIHRVAVVHEDQAKVDLANAYHRKFPLTLADPDGIGRVLRTGEPELVRDVAESRVERIQSNPERAALLRALGVHGSMSVPLIIRSQVVGALTLASSDTTRLYTDDDLRLAQDLARRASLSLDNARLFSQR